MSALPVIDAKRKWWALLFWYLFFCGFYKCSGQAPFSAPTLLPLTQLDHWVPTLSWTVWIYYTHFGFLLFLFYYLKKTVALTETFYSMMLASLISFAVFFIYPTVYPRPDFDFSAENPLNSWAIHALYWMDQPTNCFPSLHVALDVVAVRGFFLEGRKFIPFAVLWALLIIASTLTMKQHYAVDLLGGFVVAGFSCWVSHWTYKCLSPMNVSSG